MADKKECVVCASQIPQSAIKCVKCGSFQNYRRYLDFGNTAIALTIALISVASLLISNTISAISYLDRGKAEINVFIDEIGPNTVSAMIVNSGNQSAMVSDDFECDVPILIDISGFCNRDEWC